MRFALATTTIYVPEVLREYRRRGPEVPFFIAGDVRSPHEEIERLAAELGDCHYLRPAIQEECYPALSEAIGWNNIQRRNIAILEAAKTDADVIVSVDDDNIPAGDYFVELEHSFSTRMRPVARDAWFNLGALARQPYRYRGFPYTVKSEGNWYFPDEAEPLPIGVVNGAIFGDPDINATERIEKAPVVDEYEAMVYRGVVVDPNETMAPLNSQNTAWRRELAHLACVYPGVGRYDDIWPGYAAQKAMRDTKWCILYGRPFVKQDRHDHDLLRDLEDEMYGMRNTEAFIAGNLELPEQTERFLEEWKKAWARISFGRELSASTI